MNINILDEAKKLQNAFNAKLQQYTKVAIEGNPPAQKFLLGEKQQQIADTEAALAVLAKGAANAPSPVQQAQINMLKAKIELLNADQQVITKMVDVVAKPAAATEAMTKTIVTPKTPKKPK